MDKPGTNPNMTRSDLNALLDSNPVAVERAILRLYSLQTASEKASGSTYYRNNVGFSGSWAEFGTSLAQWIQRCRRPAGRKLSPRQLAAARKCAKFHGSQLVEFATGTGRFLGAAACEVAF